MSVTTWHFPSVTGAKGCASELETVGTEFELREDKIIMDDQYWWNTETMAIINDYGGDVLIIG